MTGRARDLVWDFVRRAVPSGPSPARLAEVTVETPKMAEPARAALCNRIRRSLEVNESALGVRRRVTIRPADGRGEDAIWVLVDQRPAVVIDANARQLGEADWIDRISSRIDAILKSRLALLLSENDRDEYVEAIRRIARDDRRELYRLIPDYLLGNGISLDRIHTMRELEHTERTAAAVAEVVVDHLAAPTIILELPMRTLRRAQRADMHEIPRIRVGIYEETGVQFPDLTLHILDDDDAPIRLKANDIFMDTGIAGDAEWPEVAAGIKATVLAHAAWFIRLTELAKQREGLSDALGALIGLSRASYSDAVVAACLRALVRSGHNVRNLQRVLWLLQDTVDGPEPNEIRFPDLVADVPTDPRVDPEVLAARVRARVAYEAWRTNAQARTGPCLALTLEDGESLLATDQDGRAEYERRVVSAYRQAGDVGLAVAPRASMVAPLRFALGAMAAPPPVVSIQELPLDAAISTLRL